jgi:hypothetical protein
MTKMTGASPKGRRSAPPKLAPARHRALMGMAPSVFPFSAKVGGPQQRQSPPQADAWEHCQHNKRQRQPIFGFVL